ncbi:MAG: ABC transporter permease, partial [Pyrinomonadaceae bacterium]
MNKFLAIVKREYLVRVRTKMFVVMTIIMPLLLVMWAVVPSLLIGMKSGGPTRIAVVDQSEKMYGILQDKIINDRDQKKKDQAGPASEAERQMQKNSAERARDAAKNVSGNYAVERVDLKGRSLSDIRAELEGRLSRKELDGYIVVPKDPAIGAGYELNLRNSGDIFSSEQLTRDINEAVREVRLNAANISTTQLDQINQDVEVLTTKQGSGEQGKNSGIIGFFFVLIIALLIYIVLIMYGQSILAAVVEEKETRIAEVLFSSVNSFYLILGKLIGISLVALTQLGLWVTAGVLFLAFGVNSLPADVASSIPHTSILLIPYMLIFFLLGFFVYAAMYALVCSMVTTPQEGGQVSMPITFTLVFSLILSFMVMRNPESGVSVLVSMIPFCAPIIMPIRIVSGSAPFWQIALSMLICAGTGLAFVWFAARVYRVGM